MVDLVARAAANDEQIDYWNSEVGARWTSMADTMDRVLLPITGALLAAAGASAGERVLDVGCGCGATSLSLAQAVGPGGHVRGIDISAEMLSEARRRAAGRPELDFVLADAAAMPFERDRDLLFSRFGVMFFGEPVAAFTNLHRALRAGGRVAFACWRPVAENPWVIEPARAVADIVPPEPAADPLAPGPFSLADPARIAAVLGGAGFQNVQARPLDSVFPLAFEGGADAAVLFVRQIGPLAKRLAACERPVQQAAAARLRELFAGLEKEGRVEMAAAVWIVSAEA